jgi:hypothetical protein
MKSRQKRLARKARNKAKRKATAQRFHNACELAFKVGLRLRYAYSDNHIVESYWLEKGDDGLIKIMDGDLDEIEQHLNRLWELKSFL